VTGLDLGVISSAQAAEDGGAKKGSANKGGAQKGAANKGGQGKGGSASNKIFRAPLPGEEEDSDRPAWAGVKGGKAGGGGKPGGAGTKKGDLFGDMVVILRDSNGAPVLDPVTGLVQVIAYYYPTGSTTLVPLKDAAGNLVVIPYVGDELAKTVTIGTTTYEVYGAEVDLGRLSVARAPEKVLSHSLDEALTKLTATGAVIGLDAAGRVTVNGVAIDSPLENLALYDAYMMGTLPDTLMTTLSTIKLNPAALLAAAADKTGDISVDTVIYMNSILGINVDPANFTTYYNFDTYNYDRTTTWSTVKAEVLVKQEDGSFKVEEVNVYDTLFDTDGDGKGDNWSDPTPAVGDAGADDFATAADDYLTVIQFIHDNAVR